MDQLSTDTMNDTMSVSTTGFFCDLCKLDFTTKEELKEHTWTILHHGKLNKAKGRNCVHECSLCQESFVELLSFTKHLHGDAHQDRYNTWKKEQTSQWQARSYSPLDTSVIPQKDFSANAIGSTLPGRDGNRNQWNFLVRPHRPDSRNRNRTRKKRHESHQAFPVQLNTFPVQNSAMMTEFSFRHDDSEICTGSNEQNSNYSDFGGAISWNRFPNNNDKPNTRGRGRNWNKHRNKNKRLHGNSKPRTQKTKRRGSHGSSFDNTTSSLELSSSFNRSRNSTSGIGVSTRTCSSEFMDLQTGKDNSSPLVSEIQPNVSGNHTRTFRSGNKYVWTSKSYRFPKERRSPQNNSDQQIISNTHQTSVKSAGRGFNHSIVGKGGDEIGFFSSTEATGHGNGNPGDSNTVSNVAKTNHSELEVSEKVAFVTGRRTRSSYAKENSKDYEMTMDNESLTSTNNYLSNPTNHLTQESNSQRTKSINEFNTNTRLHTLSSSDDTASLSRQNSVLSSIDQVTQCQTIPSTGGGGTFELAASTNTELGNFEAKSTEASSSIQDNQRTENLIKIKKENTESADKDVDSGKFDEIIQERKTFHGYKDDNTECSFVHIDGVRCSAKTSERFCSYHKKYSQSGQVKSEPQGDYQASTSLISLDLSTTTVYKDNMSFQRSDVGRARDKGERNIAGEKPIQMMDLSMSTNFLSLPQSHFGPRSQPERLTSEGRPLSDETEKTVPVSWSRPVALPGSPRPEGSHSPSFSSPGKSSRWHTTEEPMKTNPDSVSPAATPPSPPNHTSPRDVGGPAPTLDLSRLNLPPNVRRALAMKYANKKQGESVSSNVAPNLSASRNRFVEAKKEIITVERPEQPSTVTYQPLPPPGALRAARIRQQRSVSLDSYSSGPVLYDRTGVVHDAFPAPMFSRTGPCSPLAKNGGAFSIPISKPSTLAEKTQMIDLNSATYLPVSHMLLPKESSDGKEKERSANTPEKQGMAELNPLSIAKESLLSKFNAPALRTKIRTMSTERDNAYFKGDSSAFPPTGIVRQSPPERRPGSAEQGGRYIVLDTGTSSHLYPKERIGRPPMLTSQPRVLIDSRDRNVVHKPEVQSQSRLTEPSESQATAIALESHFRQSLIPKERPLSLFQERGRVDLGSFDGQRKTISPRNIDLPVSTHPSVIHPFRNQDSTQISTITSNKDQGNKSVEQHSKRKATDFPELGQKRRKASEITTTTSSNKPISYLPGFEVQELLRLEHQEQSQLKSLHEVQDQIKATKLKLQALTTELEGLVAKERTISQQISQTKSKRVDILQDALHRTNNPSQKTSVTEVDLASTVSGVLTTASSMPSTISMPSTQSITDILTDKRNKVTEEVERRPISHSKISKSTCNKTDKLSTSKPLDPTVRIKQEVIEEPEAQPSCSNGSSNSPQYTHENEETESNNNEMQPTRDEPTINTPFNETFEKRRKEFLDKIKHQLSTPKKRQHMKKHKKRFSEAQISNSIAASKDKILLVREKMREWKIQEDHDGVDSDPPVSIRADAPCEDAELMINPDLVASEIPVRDEGSVAKSTVVTSKPKSSDKPAIKGGLKTKTRLHVVSKKGRDAHEAKAQQLKKKRKSSNPNKRENCSSTPRVPSPQKVSNGEKSAENEVQDLNNIETDKAENGPQFHSAAVETLRKKLKQSTSGTKSLSTSKVRASSFEGHTGAVCALKVHQGQLYTSSADKTTKAFDIQTGKCVKEYQGHHHAVNCLEILQDGTRLFTGSNDQTVRSYNIKSGACTHKFTFDGRVMCLHIGFGFLYVGLSTGTVTIVDLTTNTCVERLQCHEPRAVSCLATASEGQRSLLCTGSFDSTISIRDHKDGLLIKSLKSHTMTVLCMQVVENVIYSGAADCKVLAHNLNTGELLRSYCGQTLSVSGLQVVGRVLVSSCLDKLIRCYDLMSAELLQAYGGQSDMIFSVHVSNGRIYSGGRDGKVTSVKLDLRVYHPCKWKDCQLNFGISSHMKDHLKEVHVIQPGTIDKCLWADCGQVFADSEGIETIMDHVLGHVDTKQSR